MLLERYIYRAGIGRWEIHIYYARGSDSMAPTRPAKCASASPDTSGASSVGIAVSVHAEDWPVNFGSRTVTREDARRWSAMSAPDPVR